MVMFHGPGVTIGVDSSLIGEMLLAGDRGRVVEGSAKSWAQSGCEMQLERGGPFLASGVSFHRVWQDRCRESGGCC